MKPLGLYIHIPFCVRKCHYCDFVSFPGMEDKIDEYIGAVISEASLYSEYFKDHTADTLFIGGGTPSLLSAKQIRALMDGLNSSCRLDLKEATIEANPESLDEEKLAAYSDNGIDRISIGLQTHEDDILRRIGRGHTFECFLSAYESARRYFENINIDTIFGLPGQTEESFRDTINHVVKLSPQHASSYSLKLEEGTKLAQIYSGADEDTDRNMYHLVSDMLGSAGYEHYETSNFAEENAQCRHNLKYWLGEEYLGLGAAAHSYAFGEQKRRHSNTDSINEYIKAIREGLRPVTRDDILSEKDEITEYIMLRLRLKDGISYKGFYKRFNIRFEDVFEHPISFAQKAGLITTDEYGIYPELLGFDLQNTLITEFMKII